MNANSWRQCLPGELTKSAALDTPKSADSEFVRQDQQRNIDSIRIANKTTLRFDTTEVEFGVFNHRRHVDHPIYRYLDYTVIYRSQIRNELQCVTTSPYSTRTVRNADKSVHQGVELGLGLAVLKLCRQCQHPCGRSVRAAEPQGRLRPGGRLVGYLEGRNLLDKRYISSTIIAETATTASALFNPGYGRAVYAGLRLVW